MSGQHQARWGWHEDAFLYEHLSGNASLVGLMTEW